MKNLIPHNAQGWVIQIFGKNKRAITTLFTSQDDQHISEDWSPVTAFNNIFIISEHATCETRFCVYKKVERMVKQRG